MSKVVKVNILLKAVFVLKQHNGTWTALSENEFDIPDVEDGRASPKIVLCVVTCMIKGDNVNFFFFLIDDQL